MANPVRNPFAPSTVGLHVRNEIFRDTREFYRDPRAITPAPALLAFAERHAGFRVLDLGCAAGAYCRALSERGFSVTGADVNVEYVRLARERGIDAVHVGDTLPFADGSFDTTVAFEVLEHVADHDQFLREARRVTRSNLLATVPNCGDARLLKMRGVIPEHFADQDHRHFFTIESLAALLRRYFPHVSVTRGDAVNPFALARSRFWQRVGRVGQRLGLIAPACHFRLYAVAGF